jgi:lambda family phage tail tape measure protein
MNNIIDIQSNIASLSMSEDDRKIAALQRQIKLEEDAAVKREQARLGATPIGAEEEAAVREKVRKAMEGQLKVQQELNAATKEANALLFVQDLQNTAIANAITLQGELAKLTMTSDQQRIQDLRTQNELLVQQEVAKRKALLKRGEDLPASEIAKIRAEVTSANQGFIDSTQANIEKSREFNTGWQQSFNTYKEDANNSAKAAKTYFETFSKGAEDAIVKFATTGKLSFKDLANNILSDMIRIEARRALSGIFGALSSAFGFGPIGITGGGGGGAMANGGPVQGNTPYLIGERGPEMFVPQNAGKIIPNHQLGGGGQSIVNNNTAVTYSIQAVDASSFRSMLARDPEFIHNVAEQGRRQMPIRSRR